MVDFAIMKVNKPITTPNFDLYITVRFETVSPAFRACDFTMDAARSLNSVQAVKTETVQTRQLLWISECTLTHRTGYFIMKIVG